MIDYMIEPPEDKRRKVYECALCEDPILEGDEYYDLGDLGKCCAGCISDAHCYEAELNDDNYEKEREDNYL